MATRMMSVLTPWGIFTAGEMLDRIEWCAQHGDVETYDAMWEWYETHRNLFWPEEGVCNVRDA